MLRRLQPLREYLLAVAQSAGCSMAGLVVAKGY